MQVISINFETWLQNHNKKKDEVKWFREVYPWGVFQKLSYNTSEIGISQSIKTSEGIYAATVLRREPGNTKERVVYIIHLLSDPKSKNEEWQQRKWDHVFWLITEKNGRFVTLYAKGTDPSETLVKHFFNSRFSEVESVRSLSLSSLLFRSLVSYIAYDSSDGIERYKSFDDYEPFLSTGKELWINCIFTEEKAHRLGLRIADNAKQHIIVYCHPTLSKHQRCKQNNVRIVSLSAFLDLQSDDVLERYIDQVRFLINHLNLEGESSEPISLEAIRQKAKQRENSKLCDDIHTSHVREAKGGIDISSPKTPEQVAYVCACANLLNASLNRNRKSYIGSLRLDNKVYKFKEDFSQTIDSLIQHPVQGVEIYIDSQEDYTRIKVLGLQFSFKHIKRTEATRKYLNSSDNKPQEFSGFRLQLVAPIVLSWARQQLKHSKKT